LNDFNDIYFPAGTYYIRKPLVINTVSENSKKIIRGEGKELCKIVKGKNGNATLLSSGIGTRIGRTQPQIIDQYDGIDACFIIVAPDSGYCFNISISNFILDYKATPDPTKSTYAIYAPRNSHFQLSDVRAIFYQIGYFTFDTWVSKFEFVEISPFNQADSKGTVCFWYKNDGSGLGTGTDANFINCVTTQCNRSFDFYGVAYSNLIGCAADNILGYVDSIDVNKDISSVPYKFSLCHQINIIGCGVEDCTLNSEKSALIYVEQSEISITSFRAYKVTGGTSSQRLTAALFIVANSKVNIIGSEMPNFELSNSTSYNIILQESSYLFSSGLKLPTNGNPFISYSVNASWIKNELNSIIFQGFGFIGFPSLTTTQRDSLTNLQAGYTIYNNTVNVIQTYNGTIWKDHF